LTALPPQRRTRIELTSPTRSPLAIPPPPYKRIEPVTPDRPAGKRESHAAEPSRGRL